MEGKIRGHEMVEASVDVEAVFVTAMSLIESRPGGDSAAVALGLKEAAEADADKEAPPPVDVDDVARRLERAIGGEAGVADRCRRLLAERHPRGYRCDQVSLGVLRHVGVASEVIAAIAIMTRDLETDPIHFEVATGDGRAIGIRVEGVEGGMRVEADLAPDMEVVWNAPLVVMRNGLPETIMAAAIGRPLSDILTHPATTGMDLVIGSVWTDKKGGTVLSLEGSAQVDVTRGAVAEMA